MQFAGGAGRKFGRGRGRRGGSGEIGHANKNEGQAEPAGPADPGSEAFHPPSLRQCLHPRQPGSARPSWPWFLVPLARSVRQRRLPMAVSPCSKVLLQRHLPAGAPTLLLIRHGEKGGPPIDGLEGPSLTALGRRQAARLGERLAGLPLSHLYTSDLARAHQTALAVRTHHPEIPFTVLEDLREIDFHHLPGEPPPANSDARLRFEQEIKRCSRLVRRWRSDFRPGFGIAVVAHGNLIRLLLAGIIGSRTDQSIPFATNNTSVTVVCLGPKRPWIPLVNCTRHLTTRQIND
ncbi:MAG: histidine phosphatase family protein [Puniceicoccaceae bacterium]|nr:MAG: histidine phosphatase family protein [Puniceicoccaceae bacterium]